MIITCNEEYESALQEIESLSCLGEDNLNDFDQERLEDLNASLEAWERENEWEVNLN